MRYSFLILLISIKAFAAGPFYVSTNSTSSDANAGTTPSTAWLTIGHAISAAGINATIYVDQGNYNTNATSFTPLHLNVSGQTFIGFSNCVTKQVFFEAPSVTFSNFTIGKNHFGGFVGDPVVRFKVGSTGSKVGGGAIYSTLGKNQYGILFEDTNCVASSVEMYNYGPSGVVIETGATCASNIISKCFIHDCPSVEGVVYYFGAYNLVTGCTVSNIFEAELPGSHPDLFQAFFDTSVGNIVSNNLFINNSCQFGSLQAVDGNNGGTYKTNTGSWVFQNNVFIRTGSKLDVDFGNMQFINNTFYDCNNASDAAQIINLNWSIYGCGTNAMLVNNLFVISGTDPSDKSSGWFGISEGTNTTQKIRSSTISSNNFVIGNAFGTKFTNLLVGTNWINGGNPKFLSAPSSRIHKLNLLGTSGANVTTNIYGTNASFTTELAVGDRITLGPYWTNPIAKVVKIVNATNLWVDSNIGTGTNLKDGGPQKIQRVQGFDPIPDLRLLFGSPAIDVGATLANNPYDFNGTNRPVGPRYDIGAYEGATAEVPATNMLMWLTFNNWNGGTNVLDVTTNHCNGALFLTSPWWPTVGIGPDGGSGAFIKPNGFFGVTNVPVLRNHTNGSIAVWAQRTNGVGNLYSYILDCGFTFPATNGFTLGADNGNPTKLFVTGPDSSRNSILTFPDFGSTNYNHYAFTWSNGIVIGYFNGLPFQTNTLPAPILTLDNADWLAIGVIQHDEQPGSAAFTNAATAFLSGNTTDIRWYSTALSDSDILNVYYIHSLPVTPVVPTPGGSLPPQLLTHLTFENWPGGVTVIDQTTNNGDAIVLCCTAGPTLTNIFTTNSAGHFATGQWMAVTNIHLYEYLTNGTIALWIKTDNRINTGDYWALDGYYAYPETNCFAIGAPNSFGSQFHTDVNSGVKVNMNYPDYSIINAWHHYGVTWNGTNTVIFFDGQPRATNSQAVPYYHVEDITKQLVFGARHGSSFTPTFGWLNGCLANIYIFNYALSYTNMSRLGQYLEPFDATDPAIVLQPTNLTIYATQSAEFDIGATGNSLLGYRWQTNNVDTGTNGPTLVVPNVPFAQNGLVVKCIVTNANGTVTSQNATLTVLIDPSITVQPQPQTVTAGQTATFSVTTAGFTSYTYQWKKNGVNVGTGNPYTTPPTDMSYNGALYSVTCTDTAGSTNSANALLTVNAPIQPPVTHITVNLLKIGPRH